MPGAGQEGVPNGTTSVATTMPAEQTPPMQSPVSLLSPGMEAVALSPASAGASPTATAATVNGGAIAQGPSSNAAPSNTAPTNTTPSMVEDIIATASTAFPSLSPPVGAEEPVHIQVLKVLLTATTLGSAQVHNVALLKSLQTCFNFFLYSRNKNIITTARAALTQIISSVLASKTFNEQRELAGPAADQTFTVRCRSLALELLLSVMSQLTHAKSPVLADILQGSLGADLSVAISKNGTASHVPLFESSLAVFSLLLVHYRQLFKSQISVLLSDVYLPVLTGNASHHHKQVLLQSLAGLCAQPQLLVDLYTNFDCDLSQTSIVEDLIAKCCQVYQVQPLASLAVTVVEAILKSLTVWMLREPPASVGQSPVLTTRSISPGDALTEVGIAGVGDAGGSPVGGTPAATHAQVNGLITSDVSTHPEQTGSPRLVPTASMAASSMPNVSLDAARASEEAVLAKKLHTKHGLELFNQSPNKGVEYLFAYDVVPRGNPAVLAQFFHTNKPNKTKLGEYLGELSSLPIMHAYVDAMEFQGHDFVDALRYFLSGFRLPGEAQKIDRFMEKFSDKYCGDNPGVFSQADTAYVLAFSVIMLNTDLHSKQIKKRMSKEEFVKNNRRIDNANLLADEYFANIYDEIKENEIQLDEAKPDALPTDEEQRQELYHRESQVIQKRSQQKILGNKDVTAWKTAELPDYARLIYQGSHALFLSCLIPAKSYLGIKLCLQVAAHFGLKDERHECVEALVSLAGLAKSSAPDTPIDMQAATALFQTSQSVAVALNESWEPVLACLSELDKRGIALGNETTVQVDCIFTNTAMWPAPALIHFITALCHVSSAEVEDKRSYSLQRLVEVASYNINRIRFEFNQIFRLVLGYFEDVVRTDDDIARFAVDSLRQLSSKFLERDELSHFNSQVEFMKPFHTMMQHASSKVVQELILVSLMQLIQGRYRNMKSGWKAVFPVVSLGKHHAIATDILVLVNRHLAELQNVAAAQDYIACLAEVCSVVDSCELLDILVSIPCDRLHVLRGLTVVILNQPVLAIRSRAVEALFAALQTIEGGVTDEICKAVIMPLFLDNSRLDMVWVQALQAFVRLWMSHGHVPCIMAGVCKAIVLSNDQGNENIAQCAVVCFQEMLKHLVAKSASAAATAAAVASASPSASPSEGSGSSSSPKSPPTLSPAPSTVAGESSVVGGAASILSNASAIPNPANDAALVATGWPVMIATLVKLAQMTLPRGLELLAPAPGDTSAPPAPEFSLVTQHCAVHLALLTCLQPFLSSYQLGIPYDFYASCLPFLRASRDFSASFNSNNDLRNRIWRAGLTANPPNLLRQESTATALIITTLASILQGFSGHELPHLRSLHDTGDDLIDGFTALPLVLTTNSPLAIKTKSVLAPTVALFFNKLTDLLFAPPPAQTPSVSIARHFFTRGLALLHEDEPVTRTAVVHYLQQVTEKIVEPMWVAAAGVGGATAGSSSGGPVAGTATVTPPPAQS
ncbi:hypothetical protein BCR44DRAFT_1433023 [Catenaria anguillulae PL171]|uniref:SEC7 domain-containing protein n=1 Tax=Catenaria anguillulae PL171 TaxID=765915 RepID=A0A1Y2HQZ0_9FUNG|nr:hypothetical protein BCR44DRAFT_1433023 [Catenaria anguillulae PL171]